MKRHLLAFFLACATLAACADATNAIPWRVGRYSLLARQMALREAFDTFGVTEGLSVVMSEQVQGAFSGDFVDMPAQEFLERVCTMHNLTWYYDGAALYICTAGEVESQLVDLTYMKAGDVRAMLRELGVEDRRFPIKTANNDELIMVSGPPRYVQLVLTTIEKADRLKQLRTFNEIETRIFPLVNTWADNVSFRSSDPESGAQIRGVASILQELMAGGRNNQSREATTNRADTADSKAQDAINGTVSPIIRPDNRLNAVIVRDVSTRMPMYEELIRQLDVPQRLVEIGVTVVEMTRDDSLDWQLSLAVRGAHSDFEGAAGQNAGNLFAPAALAGRGLAGALTYLGSHVDVSTSLSALRTKGKARNISRTSILTTDNIAAEITDMQSYHARVVGTEVASLEEVTAGTKLSIKPRIMSAAATNEALRLWLAMDLQDGGFESVSVDSMPMTRQSTLQTQASVPDGESLLLAGYFRDVREEAGWGIPWLRDIPWIGWLFGGLSVQKETIQRLFIITPHVITVGPASDVTRVQSARLRDIRHEETLARDSDADHEQREEREAHLEEQDKIRTEEHEDRMKRFKKERDLREDERETHRDDALERWESDFLRREAEWKERKGQIEKDAKARREALERELKERKEKKD